MHAERTCSRCIRKNLFSAIHTFCQLPGLERLDRVYARVELELEENESFDELGGSLHLPFRELAVGREAVSNALRDPRVVRHKNPPVAVDRERYTPGMIRSLEPESIVEPITGRRSVDICSKEARNQYYGSRRPYRSFSSASVEVAEVRRETRGIYDLLKMDRN